MPMDDPLPDLMSAGVTAATSSILGGLALAPPVVGLLSLLLFAAPGGPMPLGRRGYHLGVLSLTYLAFIFLYASESSYLPVLLKSLWSEYRHSER